MSLRARPLHDRIVVKRDSPEEYSKGGIFLPNKAREPQRAGEVLAVGPGVMGPHGKLVEMGCKVGDKVIFGAYAGTEVEIDGEKYQIMRDGDIVCVVDPEAKIETAPMTKRRNEVAGHYQ
jgi:chaperonin GroES